MWNETRQRWEREKTGYYVVSAVLNSVVNEVSSTGAWSRTYIHAAGELIAQKYLTQARTSTETIWEHGEPSGFTRRFVQENGQVREDGEESRITGITRVELNPTGRNSGLFMYVPDVEIPEPVAPFIGMRGFGSSLMGPTSVCLADGMEEDCAGWFVNFLLRTDAGVIRDVSGSRTAGDSIGGGQIIKQTGTFQVCVAGANGTLDCGPEETVEHYDYVGGNTVWGSNRITPRSQQDKLPSFKDVASGKLKPTPEQIKCDELIARTFGDEQAVAGANGFAPTENPIEGANGGYRGDYIDDQGKVNEGHLSSHAMHLWGNRAGTRNTRIFIPDGFDVKRARNQTATPTQGIVTFYYPKLGNRTNVTLYVMHVKKPFKLQRIGGRWSVGFTGGPGGLGYWTINGKEVKITHAHIDAYEGDIGFTLEREKYRIKKFASIFCSD